MTEKIITLTQGYKTIVDTADYFAAVQYKWHYANGYACGSYGTRLHSFLMPVRIGLEIDHVNGDKLDNRRVNLRYATRQQQLFNQKPRKGKYKGVSFDTFSGRWRGEIKIGDKRLRQRFDSELAAAAWYDVMAKQYHGQFAKLNL